MIFIFFNIIYSARYRIDVGVGSLVFVASCMLLGVRMAAAAAGAGAGDSARAGCALVQLCPAPAAAVQWEVTAHVYCLLATAEP